MLKKVCVITGGASGLGLETVKQLLATNDYHVMMACRNKQRAEGVIQQLASKDVQYAECDLESLQSVRTFASKVLSQFPTVDLLICNAGALKFTPSKTMDGFETLLQVNHLSHFLLFHELLPALKKSSDPRVVVVSSELHKKVNTPPASIQQYHQQLISGAQPYTGFDVYSHTKLYNILFSNQLNRKFNPQIKSVAVSPGFVPSTSLGRDASWLTRWVSGLVMPWMPFAVSIQEGGRRIVTACLDQQPSGFPTVYYSKGVVASSSEPSCSEETAEIVWTESYHMVGLTESSST